MSKCLHNGIEFFVRDTPLFYIIKLLTKIHNWMSFLAKYRIDSYLRCITSNFLYLGVRKMQNKCFCQFLLDVFKSSRCYFSQGKLFILYAVSNRCHYSVKASINLLYKNAKSWKLHTSCRVLGVDHSWKALNFYG